MQKFENVDVLAALDEIPFEPVTDDMELPFD